MRNVLERLVLVGAPLLLLAVGNAGCVDNNTSIFIRQVQAVDPENECVVEADPEALFWSMGVMDTALASSYHAELLLGNQLVSRGNPDTMRTESSRVQLYEADIEVFDSGGGTLTSFTTPISGFIDAPSSNEPAYGLSSVTLIDPATGAGLAGLSATVVSRVKIYGITLGDIEVETGYWDFPIQICDGCVGCICPTSPEDDYAPTCQPGQNESIDCRLHPTCATSAGHCGCMSGFAEE